MTKGRARASFRASDFVIPSSLVIRASSFHGITRATVWLQRSALSRKEAAPLCLRGRTQRAFFNWFRTGLLFHPPTHCCASAFQLGDLESEQRNAHSGDWSRTKQLCQPCFQGDLTFGDNAVFRFHSLELTYLILSVRHATCELTGCGYLGILRLFLVNIMRHNFALPVPPTTLKRCGNDEARFRLVEPTARRE
jgi:hypothetical protein